METFLVWPVMISAAVVILGLAFLLLYRRPLTQLLGRTRRAGKDGFEFDQSQETSTAEAPQRLSYDELMKQPISATVRATEERAAADVEGFKPKDDKQRVAMLLRYVALVTVANEFINVHSKIFGSQMDLLVVLVGRQSPLPLEDVEAAFQAVRTSQPEFHKNTLFKDWLGFLLAVGLVAQVGQGVDLTQRGKDFLKFLIDSRTATQRPG